MGCISLLYYLYLKKIILYTSLFADLYIYTYLQILFTGIIYLCTLSFISFFGLSSCPHRNHLARAMFRNSICETQPYLESTHSQLSNEQKRAPPGLGFNIMFFFGGGMKSSPSYVGIAVFQKTHELSMIQP